MSARQHKNFTTAAICHKMAWDNIVVNLEVRKKARQNLEYKVFTNRFTNS